MQTTANHPSENANAAAASAITFAGDRMQILFERFDLESYAIFLKCKSLPESEIVFDAERETYTLTAPARFSDMLGVASPAPARAGLPFMARHFDYCRDITRIALQVKRWASWWDCGLGKTLHGLEFARQAAALTGKRGMIFTLDAELVRQWIDMCAEFFGGSLKLTWLKTRAEVIAFCDGPQDGAIGISTHSKFVVHGRVPNAGIILSIKKLGCVVLDEASILKSGGGVIKWNLIKSARGVEYKLTLTATPAPNDLMEYASQAAFLEKMRTESDIIWTFFKRDKNSEWEVKPHALEAFYRFMASWSIYLRNPGRYGWLDNVKPIPAPEFIEHTIPVTQDQLKMAAKYIAAAKKADGYDRSDDLALAPADGEDAVSLGIVGRSKLSQIAKGFVYETRGEKTNLGTKKWARRILSFKPAAVAKIVRAELNDGRPVLVWTEFDEETAILHELLAGPGVEVLTGSVNERERAAIIARFKRGETVVLITRADLLGFGQNFQFCTAMVFSAFNDSYEAFYQAVRRCYRYGQTLHVRVHIPIVRELEGAIWTNVARKAANFDRDTETQEQFYIKGAAEIGLRSVA